MTAHTPSEDSLYNALKSVNCDKNRSMDFIPVDLKRVVLPARPGIDGSDYINATYLQASSLGDLLQFYKTSRQYHKYLFKVFVGKLFN